MSFVYRITEECLLLEEVRGSALWFSMINMLGKICMACLQKDTNANCGNAMYCNMYMVVCLAYTVCACMDVCKSLLCVCMHMCV